MGNMFHRGLGPDLKEMMRPGTRSRAWMRRLGYYGLALLFVAAAAALRWALPGVLGPTPFLAFYLAWVGAATFGGLGPGLLATVASWLCLEGLFDFTPAQTILSSPEDLGRFVVLMAGGLTVSLVAERMRRGRIYEHQQARELASAKQALERERDILQAVMDGAKNSHLVYLDRGFNFVRVNTTYAGTCGYRPEEMIGKNHFALYPRAENEAIFARVRDTGEPFEAHDRPFEFPDQPQRGVTYWDWTLTPIKDPTGRVEGLVFSLHETTERKRAQQTLQEANEQLQAQSEELQAQAEELQTQTEELQIQAEELRAQASELTDTNAALRRSERRYRSFIEVTSQWAWVTDANGLVVEDIPALRSFTGQTYEQAKGAGWAAALHPDDAQRTLDVWQRAVSTRTLYETEYRMRRYDGVYRLLLARGVPILDEQGSVVEWVGTCIDITERKRAEEILRELNATLENKVAQRTAELEHRARQLQKMTLDMSEAEDRERKRMAEILHDDLQQIIAAAKFHVGLLRNRVKHDPSLETIASRIDEMLKDAVEKSRGLSHELSPVVLHHGDLTETLRWLADQVQAKHGLVVHVHAHGPSLLHSEAIKSFLYKATQELLFNVVKHARVKEARIQVRRCGRCVCVSVSDRGRGFDPRELREAAGYGLLGIQERIELLGGRMKIRSTEGKGSTFFIVVPDPETPEDGRQKTEDGRKAEEGTPSSVLRPPSSVLRVLLADDHKIVREGLRSLLGGEHDIEIVGEAMHGREAVDLALRLKPDVIIMDVSMPLIDGDEATRQIKRHLPKVRVIALSTYNEPAKIRKMYEAGAESYVLKTASPEELLAAIRG
jgi:PAS domain S-box-containing protein